MRRHRVLRDGRIVRSLLQRHVIVRPGGLVMTTPAACVEVWRGMPSILRAMSSELVHLFVGFVVIHRVSCETCVQRGINA